MADHIIEVSTDFRGTDGLMESDLKKVLPCREFHDVVNALEKNDLTSARAIVTFSKLPHVRRGNGLVHIIDMKRYTFDDPDNDNRPTTRIVFNIYGDAKSASYEDPLFVCTIEDADWTTMEVSRFVLDAGSESKAAFREPAAHWPRWGPRGMLLITWVAYNSGCTTIWLEDVWDRLVPGVPKDVVLDDYRKAHDLSYCDRQLVVTSDAYARILRLLRDRDAAAAGSVARAEAVAGLAKTAYATDLKDRIDAEYAQAVVDGTLDTAIDSGYYGLFNFVKDGDKIAVRKQKTLQIKGTRVPFRLLRTTAALRPCWH